MLAERAGVENGDGTVIGRNGAVIDRSERALCDLNVQIATRVGANDGGAPGSVEEANATWRETYLSIG
jgi:hypothetical protein